MDKGVWTLKQVKCINPDLKNYYGKIDGVTHIDMHRGRYIFEDDTRDRFENYIDYNKLRCFGVVSAEGVAIDTYIV
jgi:hypothetical protein